MRRVSLAVSECLLSLAGGGVRQLVSAELAERRGTGAASLNNCDIYLIVSTATHVPAVSMATTNAYICTRTHKRRGTHVHV